METLTLVAVVAVALFFDFTNGFHDTANSIATSVSTRALSPRIAVLVASVLNFAGAFVSLKVAATIATGIVDAERCDAERHPRRARRGDHLEPRDVAPSGCRRARATRSSEAIAGAAIAADGWSVDPVERRLGEGGQAGRALADPRLRDRPRSDARDHLGDPSSLAEPRQQGLPASPDRVRELRRLHPRDERRPEDDGRRSPSPSSPPATCRPSRSTCRTG